MSRKTETASFFSARAARYDERYDARSADGHALRARMDGVLRLLGPGPGEALDAGMGPGRLCAELERRGWTVSGVDVSAEMVATARRRLPEADGRLLEADLERLPFPAGSFDAVVATGVLEYVDPPSALRELARVLRPGGRAVVSYPNPHGIYGKWKTRVFYGVVRPVKRALGLPGIGVAAGSGPITPERFADLLFKAGLEIEASEYTSFLPLLSPLDQVLPQLAARLGERLEGSGPRLGRRLATQVIFAARKLADEAVR